MIVATILLTRNDTYLTDKGSLPSRPDFDKQFLMEFLRGKDVTPAGKQLLPKSMRRVLTTSEIVPITIPEIAKAELLIVVRSNELAEGKQFRLDEFKCILKTMEVEIWKRW